MRAGRKTDQKQLLQQLQLSNPEIGHQSHQGFEGSVAQTHLLPSLYLGLMRTLCPMGRPAPFSPPMGLLPPGRAESSASDRAQRVPARERRNAREEPLWKESLRKEKTSKKTWKASKKSDQTSKKDTESLTKGAPLALWLVENSWRDSFLFALVPPLLSVALPSPVKSTPTAWSPRLGFA